MEQRFALEKGVFPFEPTKMSNAQIKFNSVELFSNQILDGDAERLGGISIYPAYSTEFPKYLNPHETALANDVRSGARRSWRGVGVGSLALHRQ